MTDDGNDFLDPDEIDALLNSARENADDDLAGSSSQENAPSGSDSDNPSDDLLDPEEIEQLLQQRDAATESPQHAPAQENEIDNHPERTLDEAEAHLGQAMSGAVNMPDPVAKFGNPAPFDFQQFDRSVKPQVRLQPLEILQDVELDLRIELGRTEMLIEEVVELKEGSVVTLDKLAGDPVDILVNGRLIAKGEVLVLNDNFCVRVAEILTPDI